MYKFTRKHAGEEYKFYINTPSYAGETGICGVEITPYVSVETPNNGLGYTDTILLTDVRVFDEDGYFLHFEKRAYTLNRYLPNYILKAIEKQMIDLLKKIELEEKLENAAQKIL